MKDLALDGGISPIAVTSLSRSSRLTALHSFDVTVSVKERDNAVRRRSPRLLEGTEPFFPPTAVLSPEVLDKFTVTSYLSPCQARQFRPAAAPFVHARWRSPEVIAAVSEAAGIDLVPVMDLELGHVNYQLGQKGKDGLRETPVMPSVQTRHFTGAELERLKALAEADTGEGPDNNVMLTLSFAS
ncbi:hypothetical protein BMF94_2628 [Rhodotorula taiwanensis]|uniref:Uncharacterized protein n=1 Tax=Rhodotorula taiwanensis TaxID=741276 RepID=A0A2S5BCC9_9BASI|nr:hypothetical protein BMF94_2628 [Rhodotorula taiwanensis]